MLFVFVLGGVLVTTSCTSMGPKKVVSSHTLYNEAVQLTVTREVLTNIVRSRYADPMQFIAVSSINATFSVSAGGAASVGGIGQTGTAGAAEGSVGYSDSPTITFTPHSDAAFYKSFFEPFEVTETVAFGLLYRFAETSQAWQSLGLRFSFGSINYASDFLSERSNTLYNQRIDALSRLIQHGATYQQIPEWDFDTSAIAGEKVTGEDKVNAFKEGLYFIEEDNGKKLRLARFRLVLALHLPNPNAPEVIQALRMLGVTPGRAQYILRPPTHASPGGEDPYAIWVTPRSMADVINLATQFVEVPAAHASIVPLIKSQSQNASKIPSIRIRSSTQQPSFPYRVQHRGYWFYVDDAEIDSKMFLETIVAAYLSRVGSKQAGDQGPQVVLPIGG
jgi:hypothetical protein